MNQRLAVLLYPAALAVTVGGFFYAIRSERRRNALLHEIRGTVEQNAARSHATYRLLKKQRSTLRQVSDYLLPVSKGVEKVDR
jgi:hypothetical protein